MLWLYLSELRRCFACRLSMRCISFLPSRICNSAVYKKTKPKKEKKVLPWSCMLHSTAERQVKRHVWKICSSNFLFVKRLAGGVSRGFYAERVLSCADDTAHLCSRCLSVPNTAVKHRCLGRAISALLYTCDSKPISAVCLGAAMAHHPGGHHTVEWKQLDPLGDKTQCFARHGTVCTVGK